MKVLIPVDDEKFAEAQLDFVVSHKWPEGTKFYLMNAIFQVMIDPKSSHECENMEHARMEELRYAEQMIRQLIDRLEKFFPDADIKGCVKHGQIAETILETARSWEADMIVLGSHGRTNVGRAVLGSVAYEVLANSPCQTIIVSLPKEQKTEKGAVSAKTSIAELRTKA